MWAYDPGALDVGWMAERVAPVDVRRVVRNLVLRKDDVSWGPNSTFRFPLRGGTGAIWRAIASRLPADRLHFGRRIAGVDSRDRTIRFEDGETVRYGHLISTMPLDVLLRSLSDRSDLAPQAARFVHSSSHIVGIGLEGRTPEPLRTKCWMYFPEPHVPFYRCTVFSNYSPHNVPRPGSTWSLIAEVSESPDKIVDGSRVVNEVVAGLRACHLIGDADAIVSTWHTRVEYRLPDAVARPRRGAWRPSMPSSDSANIFSRGRFGAWKYEASNQDHSVMQGVEAVEHILHGARERTYYGDTSDRAG